MHACASFVRLITLRTTLSSAPDLKASKVRQLARSNATFLLSDKAFMLSTSSTFALNCQRTHLKSWSLPSPFGKSVSSVYFSTSGKGKDKGRGAVCPFRVLEVSPTDEYATVKRSFLRLAMMNHPDTSKTFSSDSKADLDQRRRDAILTFVNIREAFESIVERSDGSCGLRTDSEEKGMTDKNFEDWFHEETGYVVPDYTQLNLDLDTLREVAETSRTLSQGGLDRGGMWQMASMVAQELEDSGGLAEKQLRLAQGEIQSRDHTRKARRRRKRSK